MKIFIVFLFLIISHNLSSQIHFEKLDSIDLRGMNNADFDWGDYDGDGDLDILLSGLALNGVQISTESYVYRNDGNNIFTNLFLSIPHLHSGSAKWVDIDNDNDLDFLLTGSIGSSGTAPSQLCINLGADNFEVIDVNLPGAEYGDFCDLDNDGLDDLILLGGGMKLLKNNGDYSFDEIPTDYPENVNHPKIALGDFNNDNFNDFIICGVEEVNYQGYTRNYIYKNNQDGTFSQITFQAMDSVVAHPAWQDLDSDGDLDLIYSGPLWGSDTPETIIYENLGNENFSEVAHNLPLFSYANYSFADYDNNGFTDVIVSAYFVNYSNRETFLFKNEGSWNFIQDNNSSFENSLFDIEFADFDRDNDLDIGTTVGGAWGLLTYLCENQNNGNINSAPGEPQMLTSEIIDNTLTLSWEDAYDQETNTAALMYNLFVKKDNQLIINPNAILNSGLNKLVQHSNQRFTKSASFDIATFEEGHYFWSVQTIDQGFLASSFYSTQEFTIYYNNLPDAPNGLQLSNNPPTSVVLIWSDNSADETSYIVERSETNSEDFIGIATLNADVESYEDTTIQPSNEYYYRIKMINSTGEFGYSEIKFIETLPTLSEHPSNLIANAISPSEITLSWTDNNSNETAFVLERSIYNSDNFEIVDTLPPNTSGYIDGGINSGTNYFYRIKAVNDEGASAYSNTANSISPIIQFTKVNSVFEDLNFSEGMAWGDYNNDNFEDLLINSYPPVLYKNNGDATFSEISNTGLDFETDYEFFCVWGDYDNDGYLDLYFASQHQANNLFRNNGDGTFRKLTSGNMTNQVQDTKTAAWNDFDNDGDLDLFVVNHGQNNLYRYDGDTTFTEIILEGGSYSYGCNWGDYNNDGCIDLYVGNNQKNDLFRNNGKGGFDKITEGQIVNNEDYHTSFSVSWGDYNNDSYLDMLILNDNSTKEWLYQNNGDETFTKVEDVFQYYERIKTGFWLDYDNDGDLDMYLFLTTGGAYQHKLYTNLGNNSFTYRTISSVEPTNYFTSFGSCYDYNNDGFSDILINKSDNQILQNEGNGNNWIKILLKGSPSNSFGVGARVNVKTNGIWQNRTVRTLGSSHSQNGNILNFGLNTASVIDSIIVDWPMGTHQILAEIAVNQKIEIYEMDAPIKPLYKPSNLKSEIFEGQVKLSWKDNAINEDGFIIDVSFEDTTNFHEYMVVNQNATVFLDDIIQIYYQYYYYRIKAVKGDVSSDWSNIVWAKPKYFKLSDDSVFCCDDNQSETISWLDYDNDGNVDLYVGNKSANARLFHNKGNGSFAKISNTPITATSPITNCGAWADYNNDRNIDLFVANGGGSGGPVSSINNNLYKNEGNGIFSQITTGDIVNDSLNSYVAAWGDYDKDGLVDLFVGNAYESILYKNNPDETFKKIVDVPMFGISAMDAVWSDYDLDDDLDLLTIGEASGFKIFDNLGGGKFEEVFLPDIGINQPVFGRSINIEDFNNDGLFDLFIAKEGNNRLFFNNDGIFEEVLNNALVNSSANSMSSVCGDINNDGYIDVFVSNANGQNYLYLNGSDTLFTKLLNEPMSDEAKSSLSAAFGDYDNDGDLDLFVGNDGDKNNFYMNEGTGKNWINFRLTNYRIANTLGSKIVLYHNNTVQIREVKTNSGHGSQNAPGFHFGLGENTSVDSARVIWPNGVSMVLINPEANQTYEFNNNGLDNITQSPFNIYPNPTNNILNIDFLEKDKVKLIRIVSTSGMELKEINRINSDKIAVSLSGFPNGCYFVHVYYKSRIVSEKFILMK